MKSSRSLSIFFLLLLSLASSLGLNAQVELVNKTGAAHGIYTPGIIPYRDGGQIDTTIYRLHPAQSSRVFYTSETLIIPELNRYQPGRLFEGEDANRFSVAAAIPDDCARINAQGYPQALFLDVYPAGSKIESDGSGTIATEDNYNPQAPIMIFIHGGGFDGGGANWKGVLDLQIKQGLALGYHVVSVGYRRGWVPVAQQSTSTYPHKMGSTEFQKNVSFKFPPISNVQFLQTTEGTEKMAISDLLEAWNWIDENLELILPGASGEYILFGTSAGGSAVMQLSFSAGPQKSDFNEVWRKLQAKVLCAVVSFGSVGEDFLFAGESGLEDLLPKFPIIYQFSDRDQLVPIRTAPVYYQKPLPIALGSFDAAQKMTNLGYKVYAMRGILDGHGFHSWKVGGEILYLELIDPLIELYKNGADLPTPHMLSLVNTTLNEGFAAKGIYFSKRNSSIDALYEPLMKDAKLWEYEIETNPDLWFFNGTTQKYHLALRDFDYANDSPQRSIEGICRDVSGQGSINFCQFINDDFYSSYDVGCHCEDAEGQNSGNKNPECSTSTTTSTTTTSATP
jgi:hypothetical protein